MDAIFPDLSGVRGVATGTPLISEGAVAEAFVAEFANRLRFDHEVGRWFLWDGARWRREGTRLAFHWTHEQAKALAAATENAKVILGAGKAAFAGGVERLAQANPGLAVESKIWDRDLFLLGTPHGTLDLRTGVLRTADREDYITKCTAVAPANTAHCPRWISFLREATNGDDGLIQFLKQWFGYSLTGDTSEHALLFVYGAGGNGKSVMLNTASGIFGDYCINATMETFVTSANDRHSTEIAMLRGARLVTASETEEGRAWAESRIKQLTGGDTITARFMRQDNFQFRPQFKLTIIGNNRPVLRNVDDAARRRFNLAPFEIKPKTVDKKLEEKLRGEWPGILRWMVDGCLDWKAHGGFVRPDVVALATDRYFSEQDCVGQWIDQCCDRGATLSDTVASLFRSWSDYAVANGEKPGTSKWFNGTLEKLGCRSVKDTPGLHGKRGFVGITVRPEEVMWWKD